MPPAIQLPRPERDAAPQIVLAGRLRFIVAATRGFCYGVDRALRIANETIARFPDRRIVLTSSILHNPRIHEELCERGVRFLDREPELWSDLGPDDVVLIPAFGVSPDLRERLERTRAVLVDTTCGSVVYVWKSVDRFVREGRTVVYHGRRGHEEAIATLGRLLPAVSPRSNTAPSARAANAPSPHVILENAQEAERLAEFLERCIDENALRAAIGSAFSPGFDLDRDLRRVGFANQTTMLASESMDIARRLQVALARRYPGERPEELFRLQDTICSATDERQRALRELLARSPDFCLIVGGFDSSNTAHLAELCAEEGVPAYHVEDADDLRDALRIRHRDPHSGRVVVTEPWLGPGHRTVGVSSGASTPDACVRRVLERASALAATRDGERCERNASLSSFIPRERPERPPAAGPAPDAHG